MDVLKIPQQKNKQFKSEKSAMDKYAVMAQMGFSTMANDKKRKIIISVIVIIFFLLWGLISFIICSIQLIKSIPEIGWGLLYLAGGFIIYNISVSIFNLIKNKTTKKK